MSSPPTAPRRRVRAMALGFAVLAGVALLVAPASPASAAPDTDPALAVRTMTFPNGDFVTARALSPDEVRARGLAPADAKIVVVPPTIEVVSAGSPREMAKPVRKPDRQVTPMATACWSRSYRFGSDPPGTYTDLYTQSDVFYCATNTWISSTSKGCWQMDGGYPTYETYGCSQSEAYGVGWSAWHVRTVGIVCWSLTPWGCPYTITAIRKLSYNGFGQYQVIESFN